MTVGGWATNKNQWQGGSETRPKNMALYAYVRMVDGNVITGSFEAIKSSEIPVVRAAGSAGTSITAGNPIDFPNEEKDTYSAWNGTVFTAPVSAEYEVEGMIRSTSALGHALSFITNGSGGKFVGIPSSSATKVKFGGTVYLEAGQTLSIKNVATYTPVNDTNQNWISIKADPDTMSIVDNLSDNTRLKKDQYSTTEMKWGKWNGEQLYRRCFTVASDVTTDTTTVATFAVGLKPKQSVQYASTNQWLIQSATVASSSATYFRLWYNDTNGEITASLNGWKIGAGTSFCMDYTK